MPRGGEGAGGGVKGRVSSDRLERGPVRHILERKADVGAQLLSGFLKGHEAASLEVEVGAFKIVTDGLTQAVGRADAISGDDFQDHGWILAYFFPAHVLLHAPGGVANAIDGGAEIAQESIVDAAGGEQEIFHGAETLDGVFHGSAEFGLWRGNGSAGGVARPPAFLGHTFGQWVVRARIAHASRACKRGANVRWDAGGEKAGGARDSRRELALRDGRQ